MLRIIGLLWISIDAVSRQLIFDSCVDHPPRVRASGFSEPEGAIVTTRPDWAMGTFETWPNFETNTFAGPRKSILQQSPISDHWDLGIWKSLQQLSRSEARRPILENGSIGACRRCADRTKGQSEPAMHGYWGPMIDPRSHAS